MIGGTFSGLSRSLEQNVCTGTVNFFQDGLRLFFTTYTHTHHHYHNMHIIFIKMTSYCACALSLDQLVLDLESEDILSDIFL